MLYRRLAQKVFTLTRRPCELRGQLQILCDEALIFAIKEQADLAQCFEIALVRQLYHSVAHLIITRDPMQGKSA
jgi:hypothetical protein